MLGPLGKDPVAIELQQIWQDKLSSWGEIVLSFIADRHANPT